MFSWHPYENYELRKYSFAIWQRSKLIYLKQNNGMKMSEICRNVFSVDNKHYIKRVLRCLLFEFHLMVVSSLFSTSFFLFFFFFVAALGSSWVDFWRMLTQQNSSIVMWKMCRVRAKRQRKRTTFSLCWKIKWQNG